MKKFLNSKIVICIILMCLMTPTKAAIGDVCYAKQQARLLWQKMKHPLTVGSRCMIYNGSYVPVYEGVVGSCIKGVTCDAIPMNVDIGRTK